jgi:hypothetical protein
VAGRRRLRIRSGGALVDLDDGTAAFVERAIRTAHRVVVTEIEQATGAVHDSAAVKWPVKTGDSKAALEWGLQMPTTSRVQGTISNDVGYAYMIKGKAQSGRSTWQELVAKPMLAASKVLVNKIEDELRQAARGVTDGQG